MLSRGKLTNPPPNKMNNAQLGKILTDVTNQIVHEDLVKEYRVKFYKLSQEAFADDVRVEYAVHDDSYTTINNRMAK